MAVMESAGVTVVRVMRVHRIGVRLAICRLMRMVAANMQQLSSRQQEQLQTRHANGEGQPSYIHRFGHQGSQFFPSPTSCRNVRIPF